MAADLKKFSELLSALNSQEKINSLIKNYKSYWQKVPKTKDYKSLNYEIELNLLRLLINKQSPWKDDYFESECNLFDKGHIVVACMPKSGSTTISHLLARLAGAKLYPLVDAYDTSEQKLYFPQVVNSLTYENLVVHQHTKATQLNIRLIKTFKMIPIVTVRNIFDIVVSLRDHLVNRSLINAHGIYIADNFLKMEHSEQIDFVIDMMIPYYFSFYVSWYYASMKKTVNMLWVKYEDFVNSPVNVALNMSDFCQLDVTEQEIKKTLETIEQDKHKFGYNKGIIGRGSILSKSQKNKIIDRKNYYDSDIDFTMIGL